MPMIKRIGLVLLILLALIALSLFIFLKYTERYSPTVGLPDKDEFVQAHAKCAGFYMLLYQWAKYGASPSLELQKDYSNSLEFHTKMGFQFAEDKAKFQSQIETAAIDFGKQLAAYPQQDKMNTLINDRIRECATTMLSSKDFVTRELSRRILFR